MQLSRLSPLVLVALPATVFVASLWRGWGDSERQHYGRFTASEIETLAAPICAVLAPPQRPLELIVATSTAVRGDGQAVRLWLVRATDRITGIDEAHLTWDADTRELVSVNNGAAERRPTEAVITDAPQAIRNAREWLTALGLPPAIHQAPLAQSPQRTQHDWNVSFSRPGGRIVIRLNAASGDLISIQVTQER